VDVLATEDDDGLGLGLSELGPIFQAAGRHLLGGPLLEHAVIAPLVGSAANAGLAAHLRELRRGSGLLAWAPEGPPLTGSRLDGPAGNVRFADRATVVAVSVRSGQVAVVPADRDGVRIVARESLDPVVSYGCVTFDAVGVAPDEVVSVAGLEDAGRLMVACELSGIAQHALALATEYTKQREQFGRPIGSFQAVAHLLAEMARTSYGLESLCPSRWLW
jgi:hypothetical protein